jgi:hypothetical protein
MIVKKAVLRMVSEARRGTRINELAAKRISSRTLLRIDSPLNRCVPACALPGGVAGAFAAAQRLGDLAIAGLERFQPCREVNAELGLLEDGPVRIFDDGLQPFLLGFVEFIEPGNGDPLPRLAVIAHHVAEVGRKPAGGDVKWSFIPATIPESADRESVALFHPVAIRPNVRKGNGP